MTRLLLIALIAYICGEYDRPVVAEPYKAPKELREAVLKGMAQAYEAGKVEKDDDIGLVRLTMDDLEGLVR